MATPSKTTMDYEQSKQQKAMNDAKPETKVTSLVRNSFAADSMLAKQQQKQQETNEMIDLVNKICIPSIDEEFDDLIDSARYPIKLTKIDFECYGTINQAIKQLRQHNETIDLVLATEDGTLQPVHIYYLALKAPKFWIRIQSQWDQNKSTFIELYTDEGLKICAPKLIIPKLDGKLLQIIIETMYDGQVTLDYSMTWKLLKIGYELDLDFLIDTCLCFLRKHLTPKNCVLLFQVGLKFQHQLAKTSYSYLRINLLKISKITHFQPLMHLTFNQLRTLIQDNHLNITNEIFIWKLIYHWIKFDCQKRLKHFWSLFALIRFSMIDQPMVETHLIQTFVQFNCQHNGAIMDAYHTEKPRINFELFNPRIPYQIIFIYGGYEEGFPSNSIKTFDIRARKWFQFQLNQNHPRIYHKIVNHGHKIYIIGGSDGIHCLNSVYCWNLVSGKFHSRKPMLETRSFHCALKLGKFIVVCGGNNGRERLRSCEIYDPMQNVWRYIAPMNSIRSDAAAAVLNNKIYIAGGIDIFALTSVEFYSLAQNTWTIVSFMHVQRRSFSMVPYNGQLYAIGGCTEVFDYNCLKSVERYNPQTNTWYFAPPLPYRRMSFSACVLENKIFVFGGFDGFSSFKTVCLYHYSLNHWQHVWHQLPTHITGFASTVVSDLSNALDYTYYGRSLANNNHVRPRVSSTSKSINTILQWLQFQPKRFNNQKMFDLYLMNECEKFRKNFHQKDEKQQQQQH